MSTIACNSLELKVKEKVFAGQRATPRHRLRFVSTIVASPSSERLSMGAGNEAG